MAEKSNSGIFSLARWSNNRIGYWGHPRIPETQRTGYICNNNSNRSTSGWTSNALGMAKHRGRSECMVYSFANYCFTCPVWPALVEPSKGKEYPVS